MAEETAHPTSDSGAMNVDQKDTSTEPVDTTPIPTNPSETQSQSQSQTSQIPRDVVIIDNILREMGTREYNPKVVAQLLEFTHRYVSEILEDASDFKEHAGKKAIDLDDVRLATQNKDLHSFTTPVPREILLEIARNCNKQPLPPIGPKFGIRLPDDQYCLTAANYQVALEQRVPETETED